MRAIRFTKREAAFLRAALAHEDGPLSVSVLAKLDAADALREAGPAAGPLERALIEAAGPVKVARLEGPAYGRASRQAAAVGATESDVRAVGEWVARQRWLTAVTLLSVLNKWHEWLPLARLGAPGPRKEGLGGDVGQDPGAGGPAPARGRREGFGR